MEKQNLTTYVLPGLILAGFVLAFWPIMQKLSIRWEGGDNNYCYLVVPLFLYLLYDIRARKDIEPTGGSIDELKGRNDKFNWFSLFHLFNWLKGSEKAENDVVPEGGLPQTSNLTPESKIGFRFSEYSWNALGFIPLITGIFLIFVGELGSVETLMYIGVWVCVPGILFLLYGWRIRQLAFPLLILAFIVPLPPYVNRILTFQLKLAASTIATLMLRLSGVSVFQDGNIIDLGVTQLQVVEACSGLRYLMPLFLLALLIGYFFTRGWWRNGVLVLLVVPLSVFFNALRIWMSGILTVKGHPELVENFFHDFSGWVIFMLAGAILFGVTRILNRFGLRVTSYGSRGKDNSEVNDKYNSAIENDPNAQNDPNVSKGNILAADERRPAQTKERNIFPDDTVREKPSAASQVEDGYNSGIGELKDSGIKNDPNVSKGNILAADARGQAQTKERNIFPDDAVREKPSAASQVEDGYNSGIGELKDSGIKNDPNVSKGNILVADARGQAQTKERNIFPDDAVREKPSAASQVEDGYNSGIGELKDSGIEGEKNLGIKELWDEGSGFRVPGSGLRTKEASRANKERQFENVEKADHRPETRNSEHETRNREYKTPPFGFAKPIAITVIACLLFVTSGYALKRIPSATNLPERQSFQSFPVQIGQWEGRRSYISQEILDQLWADDYVQASFVKPDTRNAINLLIPFYEWQGTRHTIHAPQSCLLGGGWALTGSQERTVTVADGREIPVMTLKLEKGNAKILGSYFFFQRGRVLTSPWENKAYLMWDAFTMRRTDGALVRAELMMTPGQSVDDAWEKLEGFITELWPILPTYVPL